MVKKAYLDKKCGQKLVERLSSQDHSLYILIEVISKINPKSKDKDQFKNIKLDLKELKEFSEKGDNSVIMRFRNSIKRIMETIIEFEDEKFWRATSFFEKAAISKETNIMYVNIAEEFIPYLTDLNEFLVLSRNAIKANLRSVRFYTFLRAVHRDSPKSITVNEIQAHMDTSYKKYGLFKQQFLTPIINDLEKAGIAIRYAENTGSKNRVLSLDFYISEPQDKVDRELSKITQKEKKQYAPQEPKPNYQPAKLQKIEPLTDEQLEANRIAREKFKPDFIKAKEALEDRELIAVE